MDNKNIDEVKIKQINPRTKLNDLEKTAILEFEREQEFSRTNQFKLLNRKEKIKNKVSSPIIRKSENYPKLKIKDKNKSKKKKISLYETIVIKISDINKTSLYKTIALKLDDIIKNKKSLKRKKQLKVLETEKIKSNKRHKALIKNLHINVDSPKYGTQLYYLNKVAIKNLEILNKDMVRTRKYSSLSKINKIEKIKINTKDLNKYKKDLNRFAINKLYYKLSPKETMRYKIYRACVALSCLLLVSTLVFGINWYVQGLKVSSINDKILEDVNFNKVEDPISNIQVLDVDFNKLLKTNKDTVGWIKIDNTGVNYPIVQTTDNDYYLKHDFNKSFNSVGWIFADYRNNMNELDTNTIIYGHNRIDDVMFGSLSYFLDKDFISNEDNLSIELSTRNSNSIWKVFSVYKIQAEDYYIKNAFDSEKDYKEYLDTMKDRSIYDFNTTINTSDKILTLSTCYNNNGKRLVVQAVRVYSQTK